MLAKTMRAVPRPPAPAADDTCSIEAVDPRRVAAARDALPSGEEMERMVEIFKALGDPTRATILTALTQGEMCVCDLASLLSVTRSAVSHQLRLLRAQRLVKFRRAGQMSHYSLADDHVRQLLSLARVHAQE
jgi:DNA-binding transcriptional ArsR family regulator